MRYLLTMLLLTGIAKGQTIDTATVTQAEKLTGLQFTAAEKDSMVDALKDYRNQYEKQHQQPTPNSLAYPYQFHPEPPGFKIPVKQTAINWAIPTNVSLPANRNELAFY